MLVFFFFLKRVFPRKVGPYANKHQLDTGPSNVKKRAVVFTSGRAGFSEECNFGELCKLAVAMSTASCQIMKPLWPGQAQDSPAQLKPRPATAHHAPPQEQGPRTDPENKRNTCLKQSQNVSSCR